MEDMYWDWPEWQDPEEWDDVEVVRVWRDVLGDRLSGIPSKMRSLYDTVLRDFYYGPIVAQLNDMTPLLTTKISGVFKPQPESKPLPWHKRKWNRFRYRVNHYRERVGLKIAGHSCYWDDE
jgi:hypothetical protein